MNKRPREADCALGVKALDSKNNELTEHVTALQEQNERFRTETEKVKQHYKELYDSIKIMRAKTIEKTSSLLTKIENLKAKLKGKMPCVPIDTVKPKVLAPGVISSTAASGLKPRSDTKNNRTSPAKNDNQKKGSLKPKVVPLQTHELVSTNEVVISERFSNTSQKPLTRTVRFRNDHFGAIMGYGDYVIGDSVISRVYYVEGLGHNLFSVGQFCDSDLEVAFIKHSCFVRNMDGVDLLKGSYSTNLYTISVEDMMKSFPICLLSKASKTKSWLWHRRLNHLNFSTINDLA
ncbi:integrase, catalytic region, zinc finger, CCHC-type containing protein [Tanacetum coccineum]